MGEDAIIGTQHSVLSAQRSCALTERLVRCPSFSRTSGERDCVRLIETILREICHGALEHGLHPVEGDGLGRSVAWALLRGESPRTVVLMCHYDTVDTADYGALQEFATRPDELRRRMLEAAADFDALTRAHLGRPDEWLFGRGVVDMKSGIAAHLVVLEHLCERTSAGRRLPGNVLFFATPDEESESAGMLAAVRLLAGMKREHELDFLGAINTDYISSLYEGDDVRAVHLGAVGKVLPGVYVRGVETHAAEPYAGYDANVLSAEIVRELSMRAGLADAAGEYVAPAPVTLKSTDLKDRYDVQTPYEAYLDLNYLTCAATPAGVQARLLEVAESALTEAIRRVHEEHARWRARAGLPAPPAPPEARVWTYSELVGFANERAGADLVESGLAEVNNSLTEAGVDARVRTAHLVREVWKLSGLSGPAAVVYYSPPYYPHAVGDDTSDFVRGVRRVAEAHGVAFRRYYPFITDASYLSLEAPGDLPALTGNMPLWGNESDPSRYSLPLETIGGLNLQVVNIGVWGYGAHKRGERVHIPYSCGEVPLIILETIERTLEGQ